MPVPPYAPPVTKSKLLVVEGTDEKGFCAALLHHLGIENFQIEKVDGKGNFQSRIPALARAPGFDGVRTFAVVRDADVSAQLTFQSMQTILRNANLVPPDAPNTFAGDKVRVGVFIMPGNSDTGMLEDLCMRTVADTSAARCVEEFEKCVTKLSPPPKIIAKARAHAYLAAMPDLVSSVGLGATRGYWDFSSPEINDVTKFLIEFGEAK